MVAGLGSCFYQVLGLKTIHHSYTLVKSKRSALLQWLKQASTVVNFVNGEYSGGGLLKQACFYSTHVKHNIKISCLSLEYKNVCLVPLRNFSSTFRHLSKDAFNFDPKQAARRRTLLLFTYLSCCIGAVLLTAIILRHYSRAARKAQGIEDIKLRQYGRKPQLFRYRSYVFPDFVVNDIKRNLHFEVREDDIWVVSFPKSGTTWVQEIVYLVNNGVDFESASQSNIEDRFPYFEWIYPGKDVLSKMESPRLIKTHMPFSVLPNQMNIKKPKIIYIARNPKDAAVSYFFFLTKFVADEQSFIGTLDDYCQLFCDGLVHYGPWWRHVKEAWDRRSEDNVLILFYEDLQEDLHKAVRDIADFLGRPLTDLQVEAIARHCSFESMKQNRSANYEWMKEVGTAKQDQSFMRKGQVGDWRNHIKPEIVERMDEMVATRLEGAPIRDTVKPKDSPL